MRVRTPRGSGQIGYRMTRRRHDFGYPHGRGNPLRTFAICVVATLAAVACIAFPPTARAATVAKAGAPAGAAPVPRYALVMQDAAPLRSGAKSGGTPLALLSQGELLELRGERMDYLQVYDPPRSRWRPTRRPNCSRWCASCAIAAARRRWAWDSPPPT